MNSVKHKLRSGNELPLVVKIHNDNTYSVVSIFVVYRKQKKSNPIHFKLYYENHLYSKGKTIVLSGYCADGTLCFSTNDTGEISEMLNLASNHTIMYIHNKDCVSSDPNIDHVIINSPDTDVFVLGIRFWVEFEKTGL